MQLLRMALVLTFLLPVSLSCGVAGSATDAASDAWNDFVTDEPYFDPYINVFADTSRIKIESPYWTNKFSTRLLSAEKKELTGWQRMSHETYLFTGVAPDTDYFVEYTLRRTDGSIKSGLHAIRTMTRAPEGYLRTFSALAGQSLALHLSSAVSDVTVNLLPANRHGAPLTAWAFHDVPEYMTSRKAGSHGCDWPAAGAITLPADLPTGYYYLKFVSTEGETIFPFVVRPAKPGTHGLAVVASTNTWAAYNFWGHASLYRNNVGGPQLSWSAFDRPLGRNVVNSGHLAAGEVELAKWLYENGIEADFYTDADVDAGRLGSAYDTWIFHVHAEYWTEGQSHQYSEHLEAGGKAIILSGNTAWWRVSYVDDGRRLYKNGPHPNRLHGQYTGALFSDAGIHTTAAYRVSQADHWVFEGTGLKNGDTFGADGRFGGASGHETDKAKYYSAETLAVGENPDEGGAQMIVAHLLNGDVFNTGSITFNGALFTDPAVAKILHNVIHRFNGQ